MSNDRLAELPPNVLGPSSADFFDLRRDARTFERLAIFDTRTFIAGITPPASWAHDSWPDSSRASSTA